MVVIETVVLVSFFGISGIILKIVNNKCDSFNEILETWDRNLMTFVRDNNVQISEDVKNLKLTKRSRNPESVIIGYSLYHPMTQYTLEEFEKAADSYRNKL